ncbi:hypothetical protein [Pontibacter rugosus]
MEDQLLSLSKASACDSTAAAYTFIVPTCSIFNQAILASFCSSSSSQTTIVALYTLYFILWRAHGRGASYSGIALCSLPLLPFGRNALTGTGTLQGAQPKDWDLVPVATTDGARTSPPPWRGWGGFS